MTFYDKLYIGSGPIMMLDALNSVLKKERVLIIDKQSELGGSWKSIKLFEGNELENAVHYLLPNKKGYDFLENHFDIKYENCERKFYAVNIIGFKFLFKVNNFFGKIIYFFNGGDQAQLLSLSFLIKNLFNKNIVNQTKYPKEGILYVIKKISEKVIKSKIK